MHPANRSKGNNIPIEFNRYLFNIRVDIFLGNKYSMQPKSIVLSFYRKFVKLYITVAVQ